MSGAGPFALVAGLVLLVSCSGGSGGPAQPGPPGDDAGRARSVNLRLADFPPEWRAEPDVADPAEEAADRQFAACIGRPDPPTIRTAIAHSDDFRVEDQPRASSVVQLMNDAEVARADFEALRTDTAVGCMRQRLEAQLNRQIGPLGPPEAVTVDRIQVPPRGDASTGFRLSATYRPQGEPIALTVDFVAVRQGRVEISAAFLGLRRPFPSTLQESLLSTMAARAVTASR